MVGLVHLPRIRPALFSELSSVDHQGLKRLFSRYHNLQSEAIEGACDLAGGFIGLFQNQPTVILEFYTPRARLTCRKLFERFKDTPGFRLVDGFDG